MSISAMPPCQAACPIHTDVRGYVSAIARGDIETAIKIIRQVNPFPSICGRICTRACESACRRGQIDEPIAIASLKRFAADETRALPQLRRPGLYYTEKIAVVGGGPSGLTAAHDLALLGYKVVVFDAENELGGMLSRGVPEYRLPRHIVREDINCILSLGVEARTGMALGRDFTIEDLMKEYQAVFLALGSERSLFPKCKGVELPGIITAVEFLKQVSQGQRPYLGNKVVVIGGGHTAVDAARTCIRLGSEDVTIMYRRTAGEMPAGKAEVKEAEHEGVKFMYLTAPVEFSGRGSVKKVKCIKMRLSGEGRRSKPVPLEGSEFEIEAEAAILAIGYNPKADTIKEVELISGKSGTIVVKDDTGTTNLRGVFAGGDVVSGPLSVIHAIASGKRAADAIHRYLRNLPPKEIEEPAVLRPLDEKIVNLIVKAMRPKMPTLPVKERIKSFEEVNLGYNREQATMEAQRCLNCGAGAVISDDCVACFNCVLVCPYGVPVAGEEKAKIDISQCQVCGICAAECPASAIEVSLETKETSRKKLKGAVENAKKEKPGDFTIKFYCQYEAAGKSVEAKESSKYGVGKPCMARIDVYQLIHPFEEGSKGVELYTCENKDECRFKGCDEWILRHVERAKKMLKDIGIDAERLKIVYEDKEK
ncbi:MAG: FAD-dependent oxidoreductase [Nitrospirae bacterium]|nr:FAD-dependent oxidoreductase [Nitrospirota bacterium]